MTAASPLPVRRYVWGRSQSRPLTSGQRQLMKALSPHICIPLPEQTMLEPGQIFSASYQEIWLEVGFGGGEHLAAQAARHPTVGFIGCEPFVNGVVSLLTHIDQHSLTNVRIVKDDARLLLARLPDQSISRVFVLFPDPWPKTRHHKRRIVQHEVVDSFARILKPGGLLSIATDDAPYAKWIQKVLNQHPAFELHLEGRNSVYERPIDWPLTRYEQKGIDQGREPVYLVYTLGDLPLV